METRSGLPGGSSPMGTGSERRDRTPRLWRVTRLPPALRPLWPVAKQAHRAATRSVGRVTRSVGYGDVPRIGTDDSRDTVAAEPGTVARIVAGPEEHLRRRMPLGSPADHWLFEKSLNFDVPERFVLDLQDGRVVGEHCAIVTAGGILDFETGPYFGVTGWKEHPIYLRPRLPEVEHLDGTLAVLACRGSSYNYYHFLIDVLPRWGILREALPEVQPDALLINQSTRYQRELIGLAGLDALPIVEPQHTRTWSASRVLVPSLPNHHTMTPRWTTDWLRATIRPQDTADKPRRLYVTRGTTPNTRRVLQDEALSAALEQRGFVRFDPGQFSVRDQIDHFAAAEVVVAPHGAGLTNLIFAPEGVRVLEMFSPRYLNPTFWGVVDNIPDSHYRYVVGRGSAPRPGRPQVGVQSDIDVSVEEIMTNLDLLLQ